MHIPDSLAVFFKRMRSGADLDPVRDWLALITIAAIALASIIVWNVWAFDTVASGGTIGAPFATTPTSFNPATLGAIRSIFENRAAEEAKYETGVYRYVDPSQ